MKKQQLLEQAIYIALKAHEGKKDKGGTPYILHPLRIMLTMETTEEKIVAVLHDVLEDSSLTIEQLKPEGFSKEVLDAISLLTKTKNQDYNEYISVIKQNPLAMKVKLADLKDNMDKSRLKILTKEDIVRNKKYKAAFNQLIGK